MLFNVFLLFALLRPLKANEIFEVRLDKMVSKWAGSIEIGMFETFFSLLSFSRNITRSTLMTN